MVLLDGWYLLIEGFLMNGIIVFFNWILPDYEIEVKTSDKKEGGTIHNGWIILEGSRKSSKVFKLENSAANKILRKWVPFFFIEFKVNYE